MKKVLAIVLFCLSVGLLLSVLGSYYKIELLHVFGEKTQGVVLKKSRWRGRQNYVLSVRHQVEEAEKAIRKDFRVERRAFEKAEENSVLTVYYSRYRPALSVVVGQKRQGFSDLWFRAVLSILGLSSAWRLLRGKDSSRNCTSE